MSYITPKENMVEENSSEETLSIVKNASNTSPRHTLRRLSRIKSLEDGFSLLPSLYQEKETKITSGNPPVRKNAIVPKMKNLNRVFSVLEEEFYPSEREMAHEHEVTHLLKNESDTSLEVMETDTDIEKKTDTSGRFWESTTFNPPSSPTYLPSRLNPENDCYYSEITSSPSPTSSSTSCSSNNLLNSGHRSPAGLRTKRKLEERFEPYSSLKRRAISPTNAAARVQVRSNSLINIQRTSTSFSQMSLS
ncbi:hypothetical protein K7432_002425 [Basidiobolus ranarum]|uniref:Uncharacterized protein n=1 Tax=Basidiobolus ranarum TaxID=34480 RepID=A0ABR2W894_9FUNG